MRFSPISLSLYKCQITDLHVRRDSEIGIPQFLYPCLVNINNALTCYKWEGYQSHRLPIASTSKRPQPTRQQTTHQHRRQQAKDQHDQHNDPNGGELAGRESAAADDGAINEER